MRLTTKGRFAVTAMIDLALRQEQGPVTLAGISQRQKISLSYLEQLFGKLRRHEIVESVRGPGGGYSDMCTTGYTIPNWHEHLFAPYLKGGNRNGSNFEDADITKAMDDLNDATLPQNGRAAKRILDAEGLRRALTRIAHEILERHGGTDDLVLVGMRRRGVPIARRLADLIDGDNVRVFEV